MTFGEGEEDVARRLFGSGPFRAADFIKPMQVARGVEPEDVTIANSIIPNAGDFLDRIFLRSLIRADITDDEAVKEVARQRSFFARLASLFPALMDYLDLRPRSKVFSLLIRIDDCFHDFPLVETSDRQDRSRRQKLRSITTAIKATKSAIDALKAVNQNGIDEFTQCHSAYHNRFDEESRIKDYQFEDLLTSLNVCLSSLHIAFYRATTDDDYLFILGNQTRTHVVECAYEMVNPYNGPPLVTTPGSKFSSLCSLLYEIASGSPDESFSGAINRYARSKAKTERRLISMIWSMGRVGKSGWKATTFITWGTSPSAHSKQSTTTSVCWTKGAVTRARNT